MKRFSLLFLGAVLLLAPLSRADEGMWLLPLLQKYNIATMQSMGLKLSAEDIYSVNHSSIKDAIVMFGRGCTGEVISSQGLVLTNHHCGYGAIQSHSSVEHDYLKDGFWAMSMEEEIPTPGLSVTFLVRIEDVTDVMNNMLQGRITESERAKIIEAVGDSLSAEATKDTHYYALVQSFYGGNAFYLLVYETFNDVRMVGAPPSSIGKFGADTDNWIWPRHTGDFSLFRIYADKDNKPAKYSPDNVPYKPKHHLPISIKDLEKGDFAMVLGYPGSTTRYMTSWEVEESEKITNSNRAYIRGIKQDIILEDMLASDEVRIKYASKYSGSSNYWKHSIGQNQALKRLHVKSSKEKSEAEFLKWLDGNGKRKEAYGEALPLIRDAVKGRRDYVHANQYLLETLYMGTEIIGLASRANDFYKYLNEGQEKISDDEKEKEMAKRVNRFKESAKAFYKNYNCPTDKKVAKAMFKLFNDNVSKELQPELFNIIRTDYNGNFDEYIDNLYDKSIFADSVKLWAFLENPSAESLKNDPAFYAATSIGKTRESYSEKIGFFNDNYKKGHRLYVAGIMEKNEGKPKYPDANFSMRLTYGKVLDYYPKDAVHYNYITTLKGVMEKEDPDNWEFVVPDKLKDLFESKNFGPYAMKNGEMPVNFITNNDITGGNSGSPVINAKGELIGCAFDGNWEAMSGDIIFEPDYQRCISVDIRYVLFIIDKYAGAKRLIDEMTIAR
ncbi:MAG TPA: S46 family peptidase [Tenuifilaceae bacterium]|jgi:hypothetical protein|nr:S46 family peptidase [Bacteroidales bacterium]MDI9517444.1 S46 family peptidase [Bacteroidota bacterium]NLH57130.1 S46 family peptidase [Rikenellaceae bacterium]OQC61463.1 MAG: Peptidase S46 [Bacteroidetes bacterium ADurb.Bin008]HNV80219.1 S46 family peptidase [Tenuifilaceae bacterium]